MTHKLILTLVALGFLISFGVAYADYRYLHEPVVKFTDGSTMTRAQALDVLIAQAVKDAK